jgi:hypothetical protein
MVFWFCFVIFAIKVRDDDFFFYDKSFQPNSINEIFSIFLKTSDAQGIQHFIGQAQPYKFKIELCTYLDVGHITAQSEIIHLQLLIDFSVLVGF